jgi:hypothetical protein
VNNDEARRIAQARMDELRRLPWATLRDWFLDQRETSTVTEPSGRAYQIETQAFWDGAKYGDLRVLVSVDDGGWRAFSP